MQPGDALHVVIRRYVETQVPKDAVDVVTRATAKALVHMMNDPYFVSQLTVVNNLRMENEALKQEVFKLRALFERAQPVKRAPKRPRKAAAKSQQKAFKQGVRDLHQ